jgi:hypothetical protein
MDEEIDGVFVGVVDGSLERCLELDKVIEADLLGVLDG